MLAVEVSGYTKLFGSILDSTVWELPLPSKITWITMLAMAGRDGVVEAAVPGLAKRAGVTLEQCEEALASFLSPDKYSRTKDHEGRRIEEVPGGWRLLTYEAHRELMSAEDRRERAAERQRRFKEKHKVTVGNARALPVTANDASNDIQKQIQIQKHSDPEIVTSPSARDGVAVYSSPFLTFWMSYPRKVGKGDAWKAWKRLKPELPTVLKALADQRVSSDWRKDGGVFIPHPATWLNGRRWEDEPRSSASVPPRSVGPPVAIAELAGQRAAQLEATAERERFEAAERFRQQRDAAAKGAT
jgi:hypothetical protein